MLQGNRRGYLQSATIYSKPESPVTSGKFLIIKLGILFYIILSVRWNALYCSGSGYYWFHRHQKRFQLRH